MNYGLTEDQQAVLSELDRIIAATPHGSHAELEFAPYSDALDESLAETGFLDIAREEGFGVLDAALITERLARSPFVVEAAASSIIAPALGVEAGTRPIALVSGDPLKPARFLGRAKILLADMGDHVKVIDLDSAAVEPVESLFAYPFGRLSSLDGLAVRELDDVATLRRRWRIALAAEAAGCMAGALALVVEHVKDRRAFGRPLGAFQAIQHRLAMAAETVESCKWLAFRAAWSDSEADAAIAAGFAQSRIPKTVFDLQQFSGAMGLTLEFSLHLWTYRLRALSGELGVVGSGSSSFGL